MRAAIRVKSLTLGGSGVGSLPAMERHGKREDLTSQKRRVRYVDPLVHGSLNLRDAYDRHVDGCKMNKGLKRPVMHAIIQFPTDLRSDDRTQDAMLKHAIAFINKTHGGKAVFAARLDRDEEGRHSVDVFYSPKYIKKTKRGEAEWISTTKHGKELCEIYREELEGRHNGKFSSGPRQVGIALQSALRDYLGCQGITLEPRQEKPNSKPDRLEAEQFKELKEEVALIEARSRHLDVRDAELSKRETYVEALIEKATELLDGLAGRLAVERDFTALKVGLASMIDHRVAYEAFEAEDLEKSDSDDFDPL